MVSKKGGRIGQHLKKIKEGLLYTQPVKSNMNLGFETICAAVMGDKGAIEEVLKYYEPYMTSLCTFQALDEFGLEYTYVDHDAIQLLRKMLAEQIPKWKEICK